MKRALVGFLFALGLFFSSIPASSAQVCDDPSGFLKSFGSIPLGDLLILGPDCQHVVDGGPLPVTANVFNPASFGAKCDGVTHDEVPFQAALNAAIAAKGVLQLPIGNCVLNANITNGVASFTPTTIGGYGSNSIITFLGNFGFTFNVNAGVYNLQNFKLVCQIASTQPCLKIFHATQSTAFGSIIRNIVITQCGAYGFFFQNLVQATVRDNWIQTTGTSGVAAIWMDNSQVADVGPNLINGNTLVTVSGATTYGLYLQNAGGTQVKNNNIGSYVYDIFFQLTLASGASTGVLIQGNQLDNYTIAGVWVNTSLTTGFLVHLSINDNTLHALQGAAAVGSYGIFLTTGASVAPYISQVTIAGNVIDTFSGNDGIVVQATSGYAITGNAISDEGAPAASGGIQTSANSNTCTVVGNMVRNYANHIVNNAACTVAGNN